MEEQWTAPYIGSASSNEVNAMPDWKTEHMQERHEEELRPSIAKALGISVEELALHPYEREGNQILWTETVPDNVRAQQRISVISLFSD